MSCFVISNLVVTAGMLTPGLQVPSSPPASNPHILSTNSFPLLSDTRHPPLANHQSIPQRRDQQLQRQQIDHPLHLVPYTILPPRRLGLLLRRSRPQRPRPPPQEHLAIHKTDPDTPRSLHRRCVGRSAECLSNEGGGDPQGY